MPRVLGRCHTLLFAAFVFSLIGICSSHPCTDEIESACPDRPKEDIGKCLSDSEEHDAPTDISSGCTDFMALNKACAEDLENFCEGNLFHDDTILCLTKWTDQENLSPKCANVLKWAVPEEELKKDDEPVTDELGMSEQDIADKKAWQEKRKAIREEAIGRMKMKEEDRKKEEDRVALEEFKKNDPEGYEQMIQQQEEEKRQQREFKKKERARAAALERQKRKAAGLDDEEEDGKAKASSSAKTSGKAKKSGSWMSGILSLAILLVIGGIAYVLATGYSSGGSKSMKKTKKKKG